MRLSHSISRIHRYWLGSSRGISPIGGIVTEFVDGTAGISSLEILNSGECIFKEVRREFSIFKHLFERRYSSCSQTGIRGDHWDDGVEVEVSVETHALDEIREVIYVEEVEGDELAPEVEFSDCNEKGVADMELLDSVLDAPNISDFMDGLVKEGNELSRDDISMIRKGLQKRQLNRKGIQFSEWLETSMHFDTTEEDYAFHINCIGKVHGTRQAESFLEKIPKNFKGEVVYLALLKSCVSGGKMKQAEAVFHKMRRLGFPLTVDVCNLMIILYMKHGRKHVFDILSTMEMENIKPSLFTCRLLIDLKGLSNDIIGMEKVHERMMAEGMEPDIYTLNIMARHYASKGFRGKAIIILREIEERKQKNDLRANAILLPLYASIGKADQVSRIWEECRSDPEKSECIAAIQAWGILGKVEEAEAVSLLYLKKWKRYTQKNFNAMLDVYLKNKLLTKAEDLIQQTGDAVMPYQYYLEALVSLYSAGGDIERADSTLRKAVEERKKKPLLRTFINVMEVYARRGDIPHTEEWFYISRELGYTGHIQSFEVLILAYINARTPAYGFEERMKADNLQPNKALAARLLQASAFRGATKSYLFD